MIICTIVFTLLLILLSILLYMNSDEKESVHAIAYEVPIAVNVTYPIYSEENENPTRIIKAEKVIAVALGKILFLENVLIQEMNSEGKVKNTKKMRYAFLKQGKQEIIEIKTSNE